MFVVSWRAITRAALIAGAFVAAAALPAPATAAQTFVDPGGSGASVTVSSAQVYPGQRLQISGTGFVGNEPAGPGGAPPAGGVPLIAIKPYDIDTDWTWGGPSAYPGPDDAKIWFAPDAATGSWSGYIDIPTTLTPAGLLSGANAGLNWLRILSGAFSTGGAGPLTGNLTVPITYQVPFSVVDRITTGLTGPGAAQLFQSGTTFRPNASVTVRALDFAPAAAVDVTLDATPLTTSIMTDADGNFPATARVTIPATTAPGSHTLTFTTGAVSASKTITVVATPTATLLTPSVRPGGRVAFKLTGYVGVGGTGQKVAVVVNEVVLACLKAQNNGELTGSAVLPADLAPGNAVVGFNAGTSCVGPAGAVDDQPGTRVAPTAVISASAPTASGAAKATIGQQLAVSGAGFPSGSAVTAVIDGVSTGDTVSATGDGSFSSTIAVPAGTAPGERLVVLSGEGASAALIFTAVAPDPPAAQPKVEDQPQPGPAVAPTKPASPGVKKAKLKGGKLTITLATRPVKGTKVSVTSSKKLRLTSKGKAKVVTLGKLTTKSAGAIRISLTADGKRALKRLRSVKVVIEIAVPGAAPSKTTVTLRG